MKKKRVAIALVAGVITAFGLFLWSGGSSTPEAVGQASPEIVLYTGADFTGRGLIVDGTVLDLPLEEDRDGSFFDWNDQIRSVIVRSGTWRLYQHGRVNTRLDDTELGLLDVRTKAPAEGWSALISATSQGEYQIADLAAGGLGPDISSVQLVSAANLPDWAQLSRAP